MYICIYTLMGSSRRALLDYIRECKQRSSCLLLARMFSQLSVMYFISCALSVGGWMRACTCALALNITLGRAGQAARCENFQINATRFGESAHSRASSRQTHGTQAAPPLLFDARIMQSVCARVAQRNS